MGSPSKKNIKSTDNSKHNMLWVGILIGVVVAIISVVIVLLITRKSGKDSPYIIKNEPSNNSTSASDTAYDIAMAQRVLNMIPLYQSNNNGKFPPASKCIVGDTPLNELKDEDGIRYGACGFIKSYLNGVGSSSNEFVDTNGEPYNLIFLPNRVVAHDTPHTFYVYPNGRCGNDKVIISDDSYAISYKASDDADMICIEESLNSLFSIDE